MKIVLKKVLVILNVLQSWDDVLADFSQNWANTSPSTHSNMDYNDDRFNESKAGENMSGDLLWVTDSGTSEIYEVTR